MPCHGAATEVAINHLKGAAMNKNAICLLYDHDAEEVARFYARRAYSRRATC